MEWIVGLRSEAKIQSALAFGIHLFHPSLTLRESDWHLIGNFSLYETLVHPEEFISLKGSTLGILGNRQDFLALPTLLLRKEFLI